MIPAFINVLEKITNPKPKIKSCKKKMKISEKIIVTFFLSKLPSSKADDGQVLLARTHQTLMHKNAEKKPFNYISHM